MLIIRADSSDRRNIPSSSLFHLGIWELEYETWQGCAPWQCASTHAWTYSWFIFRSHDSFYDCFWILFGGLTFADERSNYLKRSSCEWFCIVMKHNPPRFCSNPQKPRCKNESREEYFFPLGFQNNSMYNACSLVGVSHNNLVRLAEQNKCHGRLRVVDAIVSARLYLFTVSACSPYEYSSFFYWLYHKAKTQTQTPYLVLDIASPTNTNNTHILRTTARTAKHLHRYLPLVTMHYYVLRCIYHVLLCVTMYYYVLLPYMYYSVLVCITMYYYVLLRGTYYDVLLCIAMYCYVLLRRINTITGDHS